MKTFLQNTILIALLSVALSSCYYDNKEELYANQPAGNCDTATADITYSGFVQPLVLRECAFSGCHAGSTPAAGIDLSVYENLKSVADNGKLTERISLSNADPLLMPQGGPRLPDCDIEKIKKWAAAGAPNN